MSSLGEIAITIRAVNEIDRNKEKRENERKIE